MLVRIRRLDKRFDESRRPIFLSSAATYHAIRAYQTSRGRQKKKKKKKRQEKTAAGWWLHSNAPPCLRRSTKGGGASEGNWKMTRRERNMSAHRGGGKDASVKARDAVEDEEYGERTAGGEKRGESKDREREREHA